MLLVFALPTLAWFSSNSPELAAKASLYIYFGVIALGATIAGWVLKRTPFPLVDVVYDNPKTFLVNSRIAKWGVVAFSAFMGLVTFIGLSRTKYTAEIAFGQVIEIGLGDRVLLTMAAAIVENVFFFGFILGTTYAIVRYLTKNKFIAVGTVLVTNPIIFMTYHLSHYGFTDMTSTMAVYFMGLEWTLFTILFRTLIYAHFRHLANNVSIMVLSRMTLGTALYMLISSVAFWVIFIFIVVFTIVYMIVRGKKHG